MAVLPGAGWLLVAFVGPFAAAATMLGVIALVAAGVRTVRGWVGRL